MNAPELKPMTPEQAEFTRRALRSVAALEGGASDEERALIAVASEVLGSPGDAAKVVRGQSTPPPPPATLEEAVALFSTEADRKRLLQLLLVIGSIDADINAEELAVVEAYRAAFDVDHAFIERSRPIIAGHLLIARLDTARRVPAVKPSANDTWSEQSLSPSWDLMRGATRAAEDVDMAWRYKKLGLLPRGTLGREYWAYMTSRRFLFPGERGASFAGTLYHDFIHALCGYDTTAAGEAEITAFTAGMLKVDDPIAMILGSMGLMLLGAKLQPGTKLPVLSLDYDRIGKAFRRGLRATAELSELWDYWSVVDQPIDALLERYGIQPE